MPHQTKLISDCVIDIVNDPVKCQLLIDYITRPEVREKTIFIWRRMKNGKQIFDIGKVQPPSTPQP